MAVGSSGVNAKVESVGYVPNANIPIVNAQQYQQNSPVVGINYTGKQADSLWNRFFNSGLFGGNTQYTQQWNLGGSAGIIGANDYNALTSQIAKLPFEQQSQVLNDMKQAGTLGSNIEGKWTKDEQGNQVFAGLQDKDGNSLSASTLTGSAGSWGGLMGNMQNVLNLANSGWGLYANVQNYKTNKELAGKQKELLDQQIENNKREMAYVQQERARQDRMRSNVTTQRSSESNVRSW